jgi:hypothetical protein
MGGINWGRVLAGGALAGVVIFAIEGAASMLYMDDMKTAAAAHNLSLEMTGAKWAVPVLVSLLVGIVMVFFYAAARPRFGPGPKTAMIVATGLWLGGYLTSLFGYYCMGLFAGPMLLTWGIVGLVEMNLAAVAGAWLYRET